MKPYPKYKPSGIEWIGNIPEHWKVLTLRRAIKILTDFTANGSFASLAENVRYLNEKSFARIVRLTDLRVNFENEGIYIDESGYNYLRKVHLFGDEILIANVGAYAGIVCLMPRLDINTALGPNMFLMKFRERLLISEFAFYLLSSELFQKPVQLAAISSAQPKLNKDDVKERVIILPSIKEQKSIASFLMVKTKLIEDIILKKQRLIELLNEEKTAVINEAVTKGLNPEVKMKDSGITWLGEIPEHWEKFQIKRILERSDYGISESLSGIGSIKILTMGNIGNGECIIPESGCIDTIDKSLLLQKFDLLYNRTNSKELIGKVGIFRGSNDDKVSFASYLVRLRTNSRVNPEYLNFLLNSFQFLAYIRSLAYQSINQANLSATNYIDQFIPLPPLEEQLIMLNYLKENISTIEMIIKKEESQIELLKEYRTTSISEAVTGKIDVRDYRASNLLEISD